LIIIIIIIIIITTKAMIKVTQSQLQTVAGALYNTLSPGNDCRKSVCLSFCRNVVSDGAAYV